jgi:hypothetical protein
MGQKCPACQLVADALERYRTPWVRYLCRLRSRGRLRVPGMTPERRAERDLGRGAQ